MVKIDQMHHFGSARDRRTPVWSSVGSGAKPKTVNLDQLFVDYLCHSGKSRSFDEGYGKT
jgi:hypothetical protein